MQIFTLIIAFWNLAMRGIAIATDDPEFAADWKTFKAQLVALEVPIEDALTPQPPPSPPSPTVPAVRESAQYTAPDGSIWPSVLAYRDRPGAPVTTAPPTPKAGG